MSVDLRRRTAREVIDDHLCLAAEGRLAEDIERNVSPDCVLLDRRGVFHGHDGVRTLARWLEQELPAVRFTYPTVLVEGRFGLLEWTAEATGYQVRDGVDSFVVEDGWIVAQTIHYTVQPRS